MAKPGDAAQKINGLKAEQVYRACQIRYWVLRSKHVAKIRVQSVLMANKDTALVTGDSSDLCGSGRDGLIGEEIPPGEFRENKNVY